MSNLVIALVVLALNVAHVCAWGAEGFELFLYDPLGHLTLGHKLVATIAMKYLSTSSMSNISRILADDGAGDLALVTFFICCFVSLMLMFVFLVVFVLHYMCITSGSQLGRPGSLDCRLQMVDSVALHQHARLAVLF